MPTRRGPTIQQRRLASDLRRLRASTTWTLSEVTQQLEWSPAKLSRIERAEYQVKADDLTALLDLYDADDDTRERLQRRRAKKRTRGWWDAYADTLPSDYTDYVELEAELAALLCYDLQTINGLVQTPDYAREVIKSSVMALVPPTEVERRVEVRTTRQRLLHREPNPLRFWTIIDEAALDRVIGGPKVMQEQYEHLLDLAGLDNVTIQVLPHAIGVHPATAGTFAVLDFPDPGDPEVVYIESMTRNSYVEDDAEVYRYTLAIDHLRAVALTPDQTVALLQERARTVVDPD